MEQTAKCRHPTALLVVVCLAQFMVILDVAIVNVALPSIEDGLGFTTTGLQWVVNAYTLTFAGFLMLGGRASDLLGRRRVFIGGIAVFGVSSLVCAAAQGQGLLLGARAVQGLSAAIISPASLAIIASTFDEGPERNRAMGMWSAMAGLGGTSGVLLGGTLTQAFDWPAIFLINAPVAAAVVIAGRALIPADGEPTLERDFDLPGAVTVTAGLTALVYGVVRTDALGWGSAGVLLPLFAAVILLAVFAWIETKVARAPLVPFRIFRLPSLRAANLVILLLGAALFAMWFFISLYLQQVLGHGALETGLDFLPMTLSIVVAATVAPRLVTRFGARAILTAGMLLATLGLGLLTDVKADGSYASLVLPGGLLAAIGLGTSMVPATIAAVRGVAPSESGLASGMINTSRLVGGAVGLAALTTLATSHANSEVASGTAALAAQADGYRIAFAAGAGLCLIGAFAAAVMLRTSRTEPLGEPVTESG
jgi:EmrB/QacA subfamily drug resistance transporter